ncbi:MAG: hypothetical protein FWH41_09165, partial [Treponema sp.]|nr:hypothetical protein [Treponema sp.]
MKLRIRIPLLIGMIVLVTSAGIILTAEITVNKVMETTVYNEISSNAEANAYLLSAKLETLLTQ